jgi:hypothetical protein
MTTLHDQWNALYAAGRVRWMPGLSTNIGARILRVSHAGTDMQHMLVASDHGAVFFVGDVDSDERPDFADPATIGCLLHQAREAWDSPRLQTSPMLQPAPLEWICYPNACEDDGRRYLGDSEPAAILAAIAAAPSKVNP